jgi:predicted Abi (CAAX) family protease
MEMINTIHRRILTAFFTLPDGEGWLFAAGVLGSYTVLALAIGFYWDFLQVDVQKSGRKILRVMGSALVIPGLTEELTFRVILLPHPTETVSDVTLWTWGIVGVLLFVLYHPLEGWTFAKAQQKTMVNPVFLGLAGLLGCACTIAYWGTGSIWCPVAIHGVVVAVWRLFLGGDRELFGETLTADSGV